MHRSIIQNKQDMETIQMLTDTWMDEEKAFYTYNEILWSLKKEENPAICDTLDESGGHYPQWKS